MLHLVEEKFKRPLTDAGEAAETTLDQLGLDSLDRMELTLQRRAPLRLRQRPVAGDTWASCWALAAGAAREGAAQAAAARSGSRPVANARRHVEVLGETIAEAFVELRPAQPHATWRSPTTSPAR